MYHRANNLYGFGMLNKTSFSETGDGDFIIQKISRNDYYYQNTYIIIDVKSSRQFVIDPGDNGEFIEDIIRNNKVALSAILFTHGHFDHIGASHYLSEKFDVPCYIHENDLRLVKKAPNYALLFEQKVIKAPVRLTSFIAEIEEIPLKILHTPGHTDGSCCFILGNSIFTGDTLLLNEIGRTDLPGGSEEKLKESLSLLSSVSNESTIIFPGHGEIFNFTEIKRIITK